MKLTNITKQILSERVYKNLTITSNPTQLIAKVELEKYTFTIKCDIIDDEYFDIKFINVSDKAFFNDETIISDIAELLGIVLIKYKIAFQPTLPFKLDKDIKNPFTYIKELAQQLKFNHKLIINQTGQAINIMFV